MTKKQKLELTWIGKENRPKLEPRILLEDLDKERKAIMKQWAKREEQIERVMGATVGMYGDLQEIAGLILPFEGGKTVASRCRQAHLMSLSIG